MIAIFNVFARVLLSLLVIGFVPGTGHAGGLIEPLQALFDKPKASLTLVLVDTTGSIAPDDWRLYEQTMSVLLSGTHPGDRVVMAQVSDRVGSRFVAHADREFRMTGNGMNDKVHASRARQALQTDFAGLRSAQGPSAKATLLIDAVGASGEWFAQARAAGLALRLVILSDMIEESTTANFNRTTVTPELIERLIASQRQRKLLPDLGGVEVHVVGASGRDAAHMARVGDFWRAYFVATGASLRAYGRSTGSLTPN